MSSHLTFKKVFTKVHKAKYNNNLMISKVKDKPMKNKKLKVNKRKIVDTLRANPFKILLFSVSG